MKPAGSASSPAAFESLVAEFVAGTLGLTPDEVQPYARFGEDIGLDSYDLLELAMAAQTRFGVRIGDEVLAEVETVGDFARCVSDGMMRGRSRTHRPSRASGSARTGE